MHSRTGRRTRRRARQRLPRRQLIDGWGIERLDKRILLISDPFPLAEPLVLGDRITSEITSTSPKDSFQITLSEPGRLSVRTQSHTDLPFDSRTSLLGPEGTLLIQSDGISPTDSDDFIEQHLVPGTYLIEVEGLHNLTGRFELNTEFVPAIPPHQPLSSTYFSDYPFAPTPLFHAAADFDGDGHLDIATPNAFTRDISLFLGLGDGTFRDAQSVFTGNFPVSISTGDFNGDGRPDIATSERQTNVAVLLNLGGGEFGEPTYYPSGGIGLLGQTAADVNLDGHLDLISVLRASNGVSILLGRGDGTFLETDVYATGRTPAFPAIGELNGDGIPDLVVTNQGSDDVSIFLGRGDGSFNSETRLATGVGPRGVVLLELDGDQRLDLVVSQGSSDEVSIHWGQGDGTFTGRDDYTVGLNPWGLVAGDFDSDGVTDLATSNFASHQVSVLLGRPDGTFEDSVHYPVFGQFLVAGDLNSDGHSDLVTASTRTHDVSVLLGRGDGTFRDDLNESRPAFTWPQGIVVRDFNGDGHRDLASASFINGAVFVSLGRGDGTFQNRVGYQVASTPHAVIANDFNGDGILDLISANCGSADISVLLGNGDGSFQDHVVYKSAGAEFVEVADFDLDGHLDLLMGSPFAKGIGLLRGRGDGTFEEKIDVNDDESPADGVTGDFNGDGFIDIATTNIRSPSHDVSVRLGRGDGTFSEVVFLPAGDRPHNIVVGDFNEDGFIDLLNANYGLDNLSLHLGRGDGTFLPETRVPTGPAPDFLETEDLNHDGHLDLVVSNAGSKTMSVLMGRGDGTFLDQREYEVSSTPTPRRGLELVDVNADGHIDIAVSQLHADDVAVLLGDGAGEFQEPLYLPTGTGPTNFAIGNFNDDARTDIAAVNPATNQLGLSLGSGDTSFDPADFQTVRGGPVDVVRSDVNNDGRLDLVTANYASHDVSVFLGLGTGTFGNEMRFPAGQNPVALVEGDFNQDGWKDLATANATSNDVTVLLGRGSGDFAQQPAWAAGELPQGLLSADLNADGREDLVVANYRSEDLTILMSHGDGTFHTRHIPWGSAPVAVESGDFNQDGWIDLATANYRSHDISVALGVGEGNFGTPTRISVEGGPQAVTAGDFNNDGWLDLATANATSDDVAFMLGRGDGTFQPPVRREVGDYPMSILAEDLDGDGGLDLALAQQGFSDVSVLQGLGDLNFLPGGTIARRHRATPLFEDFNQDGSADTVLLAEDGDILLRWARDASLGRFDAPITINSATRPARDLAIVTTPEGPVLAALDAKAGSFSFYQVLSRNEFKRVDGPALPGGVPVDVVGGDLNNDQLTDLAVAIGSNEVFVFLQNGSGTFSSTPNHSFQVGVNPSSLSLADVDGDGRLDILATNQSSGDVSVRLNPSAEPFQAELRYRASGSLYSISDDQELPSIHSAARTTGLAAGDFDGDDRLDLVVTNPGTNDLSILVGSPAGGFLNPTVVASGRLSGPTVVVADYLDEDLSLDLVILNEDSEDISVLLGDGLGGFAPRESSTVELLRLPGGKSPTGLSVQDVDGDGEKDLLVGNAFGDLLTLFGNGDGSFQPYRRAGQNIAMTVADLNDDGRPDYVFANEALDRISVHYSTPAASFAQDREDGLLAPESVDTADLNRDGEVDLVVANHGGNEVLVYLNAGDGQFESARRFAVGTNPTGITIQDLDGDGLRDLVVANEGSNDVNVLLGYLDGGSWRLINGPRLAAGSGPLATSVQDANQDGIPDILVSNSQSDDVYLLPGVGGGFFDDRNPVTFGVGAEPIDVFAIGSGFFTINRGSDDLTFYPEFSGTGSTIRSGGTRPVAGLTGDFNGDGFGDALIAHNGNGAVSLLLGTGESLIHIDSYFHEDVPFPTDLAMGPGSEVYLAGEGQESAVLLTSFGTSLLNSINLPPVGEAFVVSGPGLLEDQTILLDLSENDATENQIPLDQLAILLTSILIEETEDAGTSAEGDSNEEMELPEHERNAEIVGIDEAIRRVLSVRDEIEEAESLLDDGPLLATLGAHLLDVLYTAANAVVADAVRVVPIAQRVIDLVYEQMNSMDAAIEAADTEKEEIDAAGEPRPWQTPLNQRGPVLGQSSEERTEQSSPDPYYPAGECETIFADPAFLSVCAVLAGRAAFTRRRP